MSEVINPDGTTVNLNVDTADASAATALVTAANARPTGIATAATNNISLENMVEIGVAKMVEALRTRAGELARAKKDAQANVNTAERAFNQEMRAYMNEDRIKESRSFESIDGLRSSMSLFGMNTTDIDPNVLDRYSVNYDNQTVSYNLTFSYSDNDNSGRIQRPVKEAWTEELITLHEAWTQATEDLKAATANHSQARQALARQDELRDHYKGQVTRALLAQQDGGDTIVNEIDEVMEGYTNTDSLDNLISGLCSS